MTAEQQGSETPLTEAEAALMRLFDQTFHAAGYREHATEALAEAHAIELVRSGNATVATCFEMETLEESA